MNRRPSPPMCEKPDRDVPGIKCGYPLPCPWHTAVIEPGQVRVPLAASPATRRRVKEIARALRGPK